MANHSDSPGRRDRTPLKFRSQTSVADIKIITRIRKSLDTYCSVKGRRLGLFEGGAAVEDRREIFNETIFLTEKA